MAWGEPVAPTNTAEQIAARDAALVAWEASKKVLEAAKEDEMAKRKLAFSSTFGPDAREGVNNLELGNGYVAKGTRKVNYKLTGSNALIEDVEDQAAKIGNEATFLVERIITWEAKFSVGEYKKLDTSLPSHRELKQLIDTVLETSDGAPTLEIRAPKAALNG